MDPDRLLDGLNDAQRRAVTSSVVPLCILAGAGSGKTRVLTRRIAYRVLTDTHDPRRVLALTFTRKAAGELRNRLRQLGLRDSVAAGTFHSVAYAELRNRWADRSITPPTLLDRKVPFVGPLVPRGLRTPSGRDVVTLDIVAEIEWAKARRVSPDQYPSAAKAVNRTPPIEARQVAAIFERYETTKRERRMVDFDDLLRVCTRDLGRDPEFAAAQRWRFRHVFVDEYQDVNPLQQALLEAWLGDRTDLCVVGDPNQAIYAWNGADARHLNDFTERWGSGEVVNLTDNYRSSPQILAVANAVLAGGAAARKAAARGQRFDGLVAHRPDGPLPLISGHADDTAEARAIARSVRDHHGPGAPWSAQAILVRTNAETAIIEEALRESRIPFRVRGGVLLDQPEIKGALAQLRRSSATFAVALADLTTATERSADPTATGDAADERQANIEALVRMGTDYAALDAEPTIAGFLSWLAQTARADQPDVGGDAVDISTFHAAKGLEWPVVHLAGIEQGLVPIGHAQTPAQQAEERRLFYVALTRAERELLVTWARVRTFGTKTVSRERSLYLTDVEAALDAARTGEVPADWATHVSDERRRSADRAAATSGGRLSPRTARTGTRSGNRASGALASHGEEDDALLDALRGWRATVAKGASVAPHVVFHDTTLVSIARARPRSVDDLLALGGVGPVKANRYGTQILEVVATHG